ncbi:MAG: hypothetical protein AAB802_00955 [Patescibacteria group bacterium]
MEKPSLFTKFLTVFVIGLGFVDLLLVSGELNQTPSSEADETYLLEEVFDLPEEQEPTALLVETAPILPSFTSQAPHGDWKSPWSDYAEEAVLYMTHKWILGEEIEDADQSARDLLTLGEWEALQFGSSLEANAEQVLRVLNEFYGHENAFLLKNPDLQALEDALAQGYVLLAPVNGELLDNPYYGDPAPRHHMILILSYDASTGLFTTHDPGTRRGAFTTYSYEKILNAIQDLDASRVVIQSKP